MALLEKWALAYASGVDRFTPPELVGPFVEGEVKGHPTIADGTRIQLRFPYGRIGSAIVVAVDSDYGVQGDDQFELGEMLPAYAEAQPDSSAEELLSKFTPLEP